MGRDSGSPDVPSVAAASDEELLQAFQRTERADLPSDAKMRELAERLGPVMVTKSTAGAFAWQWIAVATIASVVVAGAVSFRDHFGTREHAPVQLPAATAAPAATPAPPLPEDSPRLPAPVISVDALPSASAPAARPRVSIPEPSCAGEIELVERADAKLRTGDAEGALDLARRHAESCPRGGFVQERERIVIEALARLGRTTELRTRARAFEQRFPSSPHVWRIRSLAERDPE